MTPQEAGGVAALTLEELRRLEADLVSVSDSLRPEILIVLRELIALRETLHVTVDLTPEQAAKFKEEWDKPGAVITTMPQESVIFEKYATLKKAADSCREYLEKIIADDLYADEIEEQAKVHYAALAEGWK